MPIVDLLMYFLRHWNRDFENFKEKNIGLPQDEVGDCSRILANFYLHEYDNYICKEALQLGCKFIRYSDDQIIYANNEIDAKRLLFLASNYLTKINLNINPKKIDSFSSRKAFYDYWAFEIFENLMAPYEKENIENAIMLFLAMEKNEINFRQGSVLRKITNVLAKSKINIDLSLKKQIEAKITQENFLLSSQSYDLLNILNILEPNSKKDFILKVQNLSKSYLFNQFHYSLINSNIKGINKKNIQQSIILFK